VLDIPYDRPNTTMRAFAMCRHCLSEYRNPRDRRFHAQPNACPVCGPQLSEAIAAAAEALAQGRIVALKGIGGFQLLCDARNPEAVERLRLRKHREEKPFAVMMPSLDVIRQYCSPLNGMSPFSAIIEAAASAHGGKGSRGCCVTAQDEEALQSAAAPIVLLDPLGTPGIAENVSRNSPYLGVMLPYSPLHHLLLEAFPHPVVATSGNRSEEPIAIDNQEAVDRLSGIADLFLMHDRPIARPCDDSVVRISRGRPALLRRARGYVPLPVVVGREIEPVLAVGGHLKNTVAIAVGRQVFLSQHNGDLDTVESRRAFENSIDDLCRLYRFQPKRVVCDLHPDYASTRWALESGIPVVAVQHHHAHAAACAAENRIQGEYLAAVWDGTGYGLDGTIWGGEFFLVRDGRFERIAHLRPFRLPGGEAAIREGWRSAVSLVWECQQTRLPLPPWAEEAASMIGLNGDIPFSEEGRKGVGAENAVLLRMLERGINSPVTTSVGRLFDAVAAISGVARQNRFEGQAAMLLEHAISPCDDSYPMDRGDWRPLIEAVLRDRSDRRLIAAKFHNALVDWIIRVALDAGVSNVVLSGGVFQNRYLTERAAALLEARGFSVFTHSQVPPNDGGLALGQAVLGGGTSP
jgi:hydrogenase maturation protein HypF